MSTLKKKHWFQSREEVEEEQCKTRKERANDDASALQAG